MLKKVHLGHQVYKMVQHLQIFQWENHTNPIQSPKQIQRICLFHHQKIEETLPDHDMALTILRHPIHKNCYPYESEVVGLVRSLMNYLSQTLRPFLLMHDQTVRIPLILMGLKYLLLMKLYFEHVH